MRRNIVETYCGVKIGNWWLVESKEFGKTEMAPVPAACALKLEQKRDLVVCRCYASKNSPIDCLTGFPAETLHKDGSQWEENGVSNGFPLKSKSTRREQKEQIVVETNYDFPAEYNGPAYKRRRIWFEVKTMRIIRVAMLFQKGVNVGEFKYNGDDKLTIDWSLNSGHLSQMNVNFF